MGDDDYIDQAPALFTESLPKDYKPGTSPPIDGIEYLKRVQYEARNSPLVLVAPPEKLFRHIRIDDGAGASCSPQNSKVAPRNDSLLPSIEWQNEQVADFSEVRRIIALRRESDRDYVDKDILLPSSFSEEKWFKICVRDSIEPEPTARSVTKQKEHLEPSVSVLLSMSQDTLSALLGYFVEWIEDGRTTIQSSGKWIYSILACLEIPLLPEMCASLRELARLAAEERSKLDTFKSETVNPLNLIICLVGRYFSQLDLAD